MKKFSTAQKWVADYLADGWRLWRVVNYCYLNKHPHEHRISIATFRAMFDAGLIELEFEQETDIRAFCLTARGLELYKNGALRPGPGK